MAISCQAGALPEAHTRKTAHYCVDIGRACARGRPHLLVSDADLDREGLLVVKSGVARVPRVPVRSPTAQHNVILADGFLHEIAVSFEGRAFEHPHVRVRLHRKRLQKRRSTATIERTPLAAHAAPLVEKSHEETAAAKL